MQRLPFVVATAACLMLWAVTFVSTEQLRTAKEGLRVDALSPRAISQVQRASSQSAIDGRAADGQRSVDYNWDVRPILSENCFTCHGPDEKARRANLRLDSATGAYAELRQGRRAIVPGDPDGSELIKRVTAENAVQRMPPQSANKVLTPDQIATLRTWIAQGAQYKAHWAFISPEKQAPPPGRDGTRNVNDIDRFVVDRLQRAGLSLSREADKETLINRVTLALTGLPPTLPEVDAFVKDTSPNAYEKVVDRLLASPEYGEHMAAYWLNVARYADSDGFLDDLHDRLFWPYRDWVISAFTKNMPFDQFGTWQIAGDLMPKPTRDQILATAFLRLGKRTTENGAIDEEYRVEYAVERATTIGTGFLGLTVGCARCHDHKYDPISQKAFYSLTGFFNSTDEPGFYAPGRTGITAGPTLDWPDPATAAKLADANAAVRRQVATYEKARQAASARAEPEADGLRRSPELLRSRVQAAIERGLVAHYAFEETMPVPDDKLPTSRDANRRMSPPLLAPLTNQRFSLPPPSNEGSDSEASAANQLDAVRRRARRGLPAALVRDALTFSPSSTPGVEPAVLESAMLKPGVRGSAFHFDDTNRGFLAASVGDFERTQPFSLDFWLFAPRVYDEASVLTHREYDWFGNAGYQVDLEKNRLRFELLHSRAGNRISVISKQPIPVGTWTHVTLTYDGSSAAKGVRIYIDAARANMDTISDNLTRTIVPNGGGALGDEFLGLAFGKRFRLTPLKDGALDEIRVFKSSLTALEVRYLHDATLSPTAVERNELIEWVVESDPSVLREAETLRDAREAQNRVISVIPEVPVMGDTLKPRPTYLLIRGQYDDHGDEVQPEGLATVAKWNPVWPRNRLGLAQWLFDPQNPLTARVFVNRLWHQTFGQGLVRTAEDFGAQGAIPSHPELLDWLAVTFRESGWDIKRMQKMLVMSRTYRQSSDASDELLQKDPDNTMLARFTRVRMPAETVRDHALAVSGLLVRKIGGPSVYPYQPEGIWDGLAGYVYPEVSDVPAEDHHRRSLYSFIKRNAPHPAMAVFDFPDRGATTAKRPISNTPLQALVLLDDPQYVETYRAMAENVLVSAPDEDAQVTMIYRLATRRRPRASELTVLRTYYEDQLARFRTDAAAASALVKTGRSTPRSDIDVVRLAALTNVAAAVMNSPVAYTVR